MRGEKKSPASKTMVLEHLIMNGLEMGLACSNEVL